MSTKSSSGMFATIFHVGCGIGAVAVICDLLNLGTVLVGGLIGAVVLAAFLYGSVVLYTLAQMTLERLTAAKKNES